MVVSLSFFFYLQEVVAVLLVNIILVALAKIFLQVNLMLCLEILVFNMLRALSVCRVLQHNHRNGSILHLSLWVRFNDRMDSLLLSYRSTHHAAFPTTKFSTIPTAFNAAICAAI